MKKREVLTKIDVAIRQNNFIFNTDNSDIDKKYRIALLKNELTIGKQVLVTFDASIQEWFIYFVLIHNGEKKLGFALFDRSGMINIVTIADYSYISKAKFDKFNAYWYDTKLKKSKRYMSNDD